MKLLDNIVWCLCVGIIGWITWVVIGMLWCITIIGIPVGVQCFKLARLSFWPFGKEVVYGNNAISIVFNILWIVFSGLWLAIGYVTAGAVLCVTIIGIPFGLQCFKLAKLALIPFGAEVVEKQ